MKVVQAAFLCVEQPLVQAIPADLTALRYEEENELQPELDNSVCVPLLLFTWWLFLLLSCGTQAAGLVGG